MSGCAAHAGLRTAARLGEVSDGIKTPLFAAFDSRYCRGLGVLAFAR